MVVRVQLPPGVQANRINPYQLNTYKGFLFEGDSMGDGFNEFATLLQGLSQQIDKTDIDINIFILVGRVF